MCFLETPTLLFLTLNLYFNKVLFGLIAEYVVTLEYLVETVDMLELSIGNRIQQSIVRVKKRDVYYLFLPIRDMG